LIVKLKDKTQTGEFRWVALLPNGYEGTTSGKAASLLVVDLSSGAIVREIVVDTNTNFVSGYNNGLSSPAAVDVNADGFADYVYSGDLKGNLWKFDLTNDDNTKWDVSYKKSGTAYALFTGLSGRAITTAPDIVLRSGCQLVFFGTGRYYDETVDKTTTSRQSIYGLYDYNIADNNPTGSIYGRANLQVQTLTDVTVSGETYRTSSNNVFTPGPGASAKKGWYVDLWYNGSNPSERVVTDPVAHARKIIFTTFTPSSASCSYGGTSWLMELNMDTGGTPTKPTFDVNKDNYVTAGDVVSGQTPTGLKLGDGIASSPTIVGKDDTELKYITKTTGEITKVLEGGATSQLGLRNWRQLR
jgi:type IV pilus assembly protein PilY1